MARSNGKVPTLVFDQTDYYAATMGGDLRKQFFAFHDLITPVRLADVKRHTNALERELRQSGSYPESRPVNIDPGYLTLGKFLLATTKDQAHRVYLRDGIFAEVTLHYQAGAFEPWPWTYADYRQPAVLAFLQEARTYYHDRLRGAARRRGVGPGEWRMKIDHRFSHSTPLSAAPTERGPEIMHRVLLGATTALLAARMLVPGEDPGLLHDSSGAINLILVLLWLLAAVGLAAWRVWSRRGDWRGGLVETALLVAVVLAFVSAETAGYRRPARLIAWDWVALFAAVCLIRQLAVSAADQQAMFGVFLAGAAALSFQAVYQITVLGAPASATFTRPDTFAAWLGLFLPGLIAAVIVCRPGRAPAGRPSSRQSSPCWGRRRSRRRSTPPSVRPTRPTRRSWKPGDRR